jgi:hypothetical protein
MPSEQPVTTTRDYPEDSGDLVMTAEIKEPLEA